MRSRGLFAVVSFLYWIDREAGKVRRVPRAGGAASDVMTDLVAPRFLALRAPGRVLVGTEANGVFRGDITGTCRASGGSGEVKAFAVAGVAAYVASTTQILTLKL